MTVVKKADTHETAASESQSFSQNQASRGYLGISAIFSYAAYLTLNYGASITPIAQSTN